MVISRGPNRSPAHARKAPTADRPASHRRPTPVVARVARVAAGAAVVGLSAVLVWWWAIGGAWLSVRTPSMGTYAPVGTLLWVKPTDVDHVRVGDVITFRSPRVTVGAGGATSGTATVPSRTYTHRVVDRNPDGTLQTKGDLNATEDPWRVDQDHLVGRVTARWRGVGWLVQALPLLLLGGIALWVLTAVLAPGPARAPARVLGTAALVAVAIYLYNPLFGATQMSFVPLGEPGARATYVGTGMLPVKLQADAMTSVPVQTGHERSIVVPHQSDDGRYRVRVVPTIPWQTWLVVVAGCLAPAVWSVIVGAEPPPPRRRRRWRRRPAHAAPIGQQLRAS